jgi:hypothetical protein
VEIFVSKPSNCVNFLLRVYESARGLLYDPNLGFSAACLVVRVLKELQIQVRFPLFSVFFASFCSYLHFLRQNTQMAHDLEKTKSMLDTPAVWLDENVVVNDYCQFLLARPHLLRAVVIN